MIKNRSDRYRTSSRRSKDACHPQFPELPEVIGYAEENENHKKAQDPEILCFFCFAAFGERTKETEIIGQNKLLFAFFARRNCFAGGRLRYARCPRLFRYEFYLSEQARRQNGRGSFAFPWRLAIFLRLCRKQACSNRSRSSTRCPRPAP